MPEDEHDEFLEEVKSLKDRYETLKDQRIRNEERLSAAEAKLKSVRAQAKKEFGTDDLEALKKMLRKQEKENAKQRAAYEASLSEIEKRIAEVEARYHQEDDE